MGFQPGAQILVAAIHRVGDHPSHRHASLMQALEHLKCQVGFGAKGDGVGNARLLATHMIVEPVLRYVEFAINERMTAGRDIGEEDPYLAVLHVPGRAAILLFDACRVRATVALCRRATFLKPVWEQNWLEGSARRGVGLKRGSHLFKASNRQMHGLAQPIGVVLPIDASIGHPTGAAFGA